MAIHLSLGYKRGVMQTFNLYSFLADAEERKRQAGIDESAAAVEALRNKGARRTPAKRAMLRRAEDRARRAGIDPVPSYF